MRTVAAMVVVAAVASVSACASTGGTSRSHPDRLTAEEIAGSDLSTAYDVVRNLRPRWLQVRGRTSVYYENPIVVYVDGMRMGGPESLAEIPRVIVQSMRYHSPPQAQARWGLNHTNGAIEVVIGG